MSKEINMKQMSLLEDSPVNRSVSQVKEKELMTIDTSGMKLLESLENVSPDGSLAKMLKALLTSTTAWYSDRCKLTWKKKVSKSNVLLFQLQASVLGTKEKEFGLWATPNTMDVLPPRSKEGTIRQMTTARKGRTKPANLREQVDPSTMEMYGWMYPTPSAQEAGEGEFLETLTSKDGTPLKPNERAYNPKTNKHVQITLNRMVKMFPTPTASDIEGGVSKDVQFKNGHFFRENKKGERWGVKLRDAMSMYPTPTATERSGINPKTGRGGGLNHLITVKMYPTPRANEPGRTTKGYGRALGELMEGKEQMYPTPTTQEIEHPHMELTKTGRRKSKDGKNSHSLNLADTVKKPGGKLNPEFVEFLMGYPLNWTKLDPTE